MPYNVDKVDTRYTVDLYVDHATATRTDTRTELI